MANFSIANVKQLVLATVIALAMGLVASSAAHAGAVDNYFWSVARTSNGGPGALLKIDKSANSIVATIGLGGGDPFGIAVDQDSVWVADYLGYGNNSYG